jgi:hypothetical protein
MKLLRNVVVARCVETCSAFICIREDLKLLLMLQDINSLQFYLNIYELLVQISYFSHHYLIYRSFLTNYVLVTK